MEVTQTHSGLDDVGGAGTQDLVELVHLCEGGFMHNVSVTIILKFV